MRVLRSPVLQFLLVGIVTLVGLVVVANDLAERAAEQEALAEAEGTNELLARLVARPALPLGITRLDVGAADRFDRQMQEALRLNEQQVERIIIWRTDGTVLYSDDFDLFGRQLPLTGVQRRVLQGRDDATRTMSETAGRGRTVDALETEADRVRIYTRIRTPSGGRVLFEAAYALTGIEQRREEIYQSFRWITLGGPALLLVLFTPPLHVLTRRLTRAGQERERLLRSAIDASDAERRRIARDLHDGVVQDLAGTAYSVGALARDRNTPDQTRQTLAAAGGSLRDSLSSLRSLLAEIHPPDLHAAGLPAALADLIAPAQREGVQASVSVSGVDDADDAAVALVWRVAQEAVRNALRHAGASTLAVTVRGDGRLLFLEVVDDGVGFDPAAPPVPDRYGLRGMQTLVADTGGRLEIASAPGEGTAVRLEVELR